ncbi:MAG: methyltransferase regulatory domain-containing protein [Rickettsiales bacterium]|nr:methyltransferase regulatory domain-containing protein [Pseudomonadota bacterium]MDA0965875.1 methyltransferase regulatory domain-containing protein [Pseudomonadota bacterium]MDG4542655.1 methyltransferase regulatory domain-containing protein [Rickettsiales bacterium]MDG4545159.1 methyltransferase regulatory domain-containing protein [Rickettsiales bacterium]MDG4547282.1 methyltransferase regulatory domain-containing protein [Rickettsiales bacterium]
MAAEKIQNDYDIVPYISYPYSNTHPEHLYTVARFFDADVVNPKKARVLELGCASGGNIIPMAIKFPDSEFVGVDYSSVQIAEANKHKENMGLKNLEFKGISIADIDKKLGKFDYIIVHGILSWVPKDIQDKIFEICNENLSDKGVAYISYNTLPGWGVVRSIREMMLYHTGNFPNPADKIREARMLLNFIKHGNGTNTDTAYTKFIQNEIDTLSNCSDSYLIHDHLEENNEPFYFHEFMKKANENNLQYLGDASVATMFIGNFPKETAEVLKKVGNDIVRAEQYMDFIRNRRFRSTLLCKKGAKINRTINSSKLKEFYVSSDIVPDFDVKDADPFANKPFPFKKSRGGNEFQVNDKYLLTALLYIIEEKKAVSVKNVIEEVKKRLGSHIKKDDFEEPLLNKMLILIFSNNLDISSQPPAYVTSVSEKPKTSELARYQATYTDWITNQLANKVSIDLFGRVLIQYVNGENDFKAIVESLKKHVLKGELVVNNNNQKITDEKQIEDELRKLTEQALKKMALSCTLIA